MSGGDAALLLADAIKRRADYEGVGWRHRFFVDAKDGKARRFFLRFGFIPLDDDPLKLFLQLSTLVKGA